MDYCDLGSSGSDSDNDNGDLTGTAIDRYLITTSLLLLTLIYV